jgi:hypothetical protein
LVRIAWEIWFVWKEIVRRVTFHHLIFAFYWVGGGFWQGQPGRSALYDAVAAAACLVGVVAGPLDVVGVVADGPGVLD